MLVLGLDFETTGLDLEKDDIIEVGAVLWDTVRGKPVEMLSELIRTEKQLEEVITKLTGITSEDLAMYGGDFDPSMVKLFEMANRAKVIVAHNGTTFDRPILISNVKRRSRVPATELSVIQSCLWVDTMTDIDYPPEIQTRKLTHLAAEHGFVNPFSHRALFDVLTMLKVCEAYDWNKIILNAKTPNVKLIAKTTFAQKDFAKKLNYRWDGDLKQWAKTVKEHAVEAERVAAQQAGFMIKTEAATTQDPNKF